MVANSRGESHSRTARRLNQPRRALVAAFGGLPVAVDRARVDVVRDEWRVYERWWTEQPIRRRYFDVVLETGENVVVFYDELSKLWLRQRA